jgi:hypothetical protein
MDLVNNAGITGLLEASGPFDAEHADLDTWTESCIWPATSHRTLPASN